MNSSRLLINNVTTDELGVYYCMSTNTQPEFSNGTRLYITGKLSIGTKNFQNTDYVKTTNVDF